MLIAFLYLFVTANYCYFCVKDLSFILHNRRVPHNVRYLEQRNLRSSPLKGDRPFNINHMFRSAPEFILYANSNYVEIPGTTKPIMNGSFLVPEKITDVSSALEKRSLMDTSVISSYNAKKKNEDDSEASLIASGTDVTNCVDNEYESMAFDENIVKHGEVEIPQEDFQRAMNLQGSQNFVMPDNTETNGDEIYSNQSRSDEIIDSTEVFQIKDGINKYSNFHQENDLHANNNSFVNNHFKRSYDESKKPFLPSGSGTSNALDIEESARQLYKPWVDENNLINIPKSTAVSPPIKWLDKIKSLWLEGSVEHTASWLKSFNGEQTMEVDCFITAIDERSAIVPGQRTILEIPVHHRSRIYESMKKQKADVIVIGWVDRTGASIGASSTSQNDEENATMLSFAAACEPTELAMLDETGQIALRVIGRLRVIHARNPTDDGQLFITVQKISDVRYGALQNPALSRTNVELLHSLTDRCNMEESKLRRLENKKELQQSIEERESLDERFDAIINSCEDIVAEPSLGPTEEELVEWISFLSLDYHVRAQHRLWAFQQTNSEIRLDVVRQALQEKLKLLQSEIRLIKEGLGIKG